VIGGIEALLFLLGGGAFAKLLQKLCKPSLEEERIALRATLFFGWASLSSLLVISAWSTSWSEFSWPPFDAILTPALFAWPASFVLSRLANKGVLLWGLASFWCLGLFGIEWVLDAVSSAPLLLLSLCVRVGLSYWLARAMTARVWPAMRSALHGLSFFSTLLFLLPLGLFQAFEQPLPTISLSMARGIFAMLLGLIAVFFGVWSAMEMIRAEGTPDPLDPPLRLIESGPYRYLRHPLQLVEVLSVWVLALVGWHLWLTLYATAFSVLLLGPMRIIEEEILAQRFGDEVDKYQREVSAFWPWMRRDRISR
jgi:protein-S-isoprenylcysteine O-methyltransferase Ste14